MVGKIVIGSLGVLLVGVNTEAIPVDHPYQDIPVRNVFKLNPLTAPPTNTLPQVTPTKIVPTGLTDCVGRTVALFKLQFPSTPGQPAKEESFILAEGQRAGDIEVIKIDKQAGAITFNNNGTIIRLTLEKDGAKIPNTPATPVAGVPVPGANAPAPMPLPGAVPVPPALSSNTAMKSIPTRHQPALTNPTPPTLAVPQPTQQQKPLTAEEQIILMELEREATKGQVQNGKLPPLPPTPIAPQ
jgi:hypothetical protein